MEKILLTNRAPEEKINCNNCAHLPCSKKCVCGNDKNIISEARIQELC